MAKLKGPWWPHNPLAVLHFSPAMVRALREHPEIMTQAIKNQYRQMSFMFPPHRAGDVEGREIIKAYEFLKAIAEDPTERQRWWTFLVNEFLDETDNARSLLQRAKEDLAKATSTVVGLEAQLKHRSQETNQLRIDAELHKIDTSEAEKSVTLGVCEPETNDSRTWKPLDYWIANAATLRATIRPHMPWFSLTLPAFVVVQSERAKPELLFIAADGLGYRCKVNAKLDIRDQGRHTVTALLSHKLRAERDKLFLQQSEAYQIRKARADQAALLVPAYQRMYDRFLKLKTIVDAEDADLTTVKDIAAREAYPSINFPTASEQIATWEEYEFWRIVWQHLHTLKGLTYHSIRKRFCNEIAQDFRCKLSNNRKAAARPITLPVRTKVKVPMSEARLRAVVLAYWQTEIPTYHRIIGSLPAKDVPDNQIANRLLIVGTHPHRLSRDLPGLRPLLTVGNRLVTCDAPIEASKLVSRIDIALIIRDVVTLDEVMRQAYLSLIDLLTPEGEVPNG